MADGVVYRFGGERNRNQKNKRSFSISYETDSNQNEVEALDPRIQVELEKLNKTSDDINVLERVSDNLSVLMQQENEESTKNLNALEEKLGTCVKRAQPYYEARIKLREMQVNTQNAAKRYDKAHNDLTLAKEMVRVAEDCYSALGRPNDSAWQEMLNHATVKVNEAELERKKSELEHERMTQSFNEAQQMVTTLQKQQKRSIAKSRPYFEMKAQINQKMEDNKKKLFEFEKSIAEAKALYAETLCTLEKISDEIHHKRRENYRSRKRKSVHGDYSFFGSKHKQEDEKDSRGQNIGPTEAETLNTGVAAVAKLGVIMRRASIEQSPTHTLENVSNKIETNENTLPSVAETENVDLTSVKVSSNSALLRTQTQTAQLGSVSVVQPGVTDASLITKVLRKQMPDDTSDVKEVAEVKTVTEMLSETSNDMCNLSEVPKIHLSPVKMPVYSELISDSSYSLAGPSSPNADVMKSIMRQKIASNSGPYLVVKPRESCMNDDGSDQESVSSSYVGNNLLSDEQIESLMLDGVDSKEIPDRKISEELGFFKGLEMPKRLSYLEKFVSFDPVWIDDDYDDDIDEQSVESLD